MLTRAPIRHPGPPIQASPHSLFDVTQFHFGAVNINSGGFVSGHSAPFTVLSATKGVVSFWANFDNTISSPLGFIQLVASGLTPAGLNRGPQINITLDSQGVNLTILDSIWGLSNGSGRIGGAGLTWIDTPYLVNFGGNNTWNHYIFSWDLSQLNNDSDFGPLNSQFVNIYPNNVIRFQMGISGAVFDSLPTGQSGRSGFTIMAFAVNPPGGQFNYSITPMQFGRTDVWKIASGANGNTKFAYCYFGIVPSNGAFFDLTNTSNLRQFITVGGGPTNLGAQGSNVPSLKPIFIHTGNADDITVGTPGMETTAPYFSWNNVNAEAWASNGIASTNGPTLR